MGQICNIFFLPFFTILLGKMAKLAAANGLIATSESPSTPRILAMKAA